MRFKFLSILVILINSLEFFDRIGNSKVVAHAEMENSQKSNQNIGDQIEAGITNEEDNELYDPKKVCKENGVSSNEDFHGSANLYQHNEAGSSSCHHGGNLGHPRRKKRDIFSDLLVSNLISVITGAFANDFTASSYWDKVVNCFDTLKKQYFVHGWKRCWEYAKLGEQKWRKSLKPHMIAEILRLSAKKLKAVNLRHYNAAMIQIQDEFDKILLDGSQSRRILDILRDAEIKLPDLKWTPIKVEIQPGEVAIKMLEMDMSRSSFEFRYRLQLYNGLLDILNKEFQTYFDKISKGNSLNFPRDHTILHAILARMIGKKYSEDKKQKETAERLFHLSRCFLDIKEKGNAKLLEEVNTRTNDLMKEKWARNNSADAKKLFDAIYANYKPFLLPIGESESGTFCHDSVKDVSQLQLNFAQINKRRFVQFNAWKLGVHGTTAALMLAKIGADIQRIFFPFPKKEIDKKMHLESHVNLPDFKGKYMPKNEDEEIMTVEEVMNMQDRERQARHARRFFGKIVKWIDAELLGHPSLLNQFFMHSVLIGYAAQMSTQKPVIEKLEKLNKCLLELIEKGEAAAVANRRKHEKRNEKKGKDQEDEESIRLGRFEGHNRNILKYSVLEGEIGKNLKRIKEEANSKHYYYEIGAVKFVSIIVKNYTDILGEEENQTTATNANAKDGEGESAKGKDSEDECSYASGVLRIDIGEIDERLTVKLGLDKMGVKGNDAAKMLIEEIEKDLQKMFFPNPKVLQAKHLINKQEYIFYRYGKVNEMSVEEMETLDKLMLQATIALFGYILANDLVTMEKQLCRMTKILGTEPFVADKDLPQKFRTIVENILEQIYILIKVDPRHEWEMADEQKMAEFVRNEFDKYENEIANGLPISEMRSRRDISDEKMGEILKEQNGDGDQQIREETITIPMRLTEDMLKITVAKLKYLPKEKQLDKWEAKEVPHHHKGSEPSRTSHNRRRQKRLVDAIVWGLVTGFVGNVISQYIDLAKTIKSCVVSAFNFIRRSKSETKCQIIWTVDVLRKQREKGMQNFIARAYKIMIAKLVEIDQIGNARNELYEEMRQYLIAMVHGKELVIEDLGEAALGNLLLELDILDYKDFRHHIESIIDENMQETVILRVLKDFSEKGWISQKACVQNHERIQLRIYRKKCKEKWLKNRNLVDLMEDKWSGDCGE